MSDKLGGALSAQLVISNAGALGQLLLIFIAVEYRLFAGGASDAEVIGPEFSEPLYEHFQGAPYELQVRCPGGPLDFNVLLYWPDGDYPGHMKPYGDWAYLRH